MKKIQIVTDSACDLTLEELRELEIMYVPAYVVVDGKKYKQHQDITTDELYHQLIDEGKKVSTAAPAPGEFERVFSKAFEKAESVLFISLHSKLSAIYQTAKMVAKQYFSDREIYVLDSKTVSLAQALLVQEAALMNKKNKSLEEIINRIEKLSKFAYALPLLDTLEYIYRGGRIKFYQKLLGNILGIKALVRIDPSGASVDGKVRGKKNALIHLKMCGLEIQEHLKINRMYVAYTTNKLLAEEIVEFLKENGRKDVEVRIGQLGAVVGAHGGNDVVGYGFIGKYDSKMFNNIGEYTVDPVKQKIFSKIKG